MSNSTISAIRKGVAANIIRNPQDMRIIDRLPADDRSRWLATAHIIYCKMGFPGERNRANRIYVVGEILGHTIKDSKELTIGEVRALGRAMDAFADDVRVIAQQLLKEKDA